MKDSRIGTYGSVGILLMILSKIFSINEIEIQKIPMVIIAAHAFSRVMPVLIIFTTSYVRNDLTSKIKPIGKKGSIADLISAIIFGSALLFFFPIEFILTSVSLFIITTLIFRRYIVKKIGGYTGDCLGALQQINELLFYLTFLSYPILTKWIQ